MRKRPAQLVNPLDGHNQQTLKNLGIPTGKERTLADQRLRKADPSAGKPKTVIGNIDDGTALQNVLNILGLRGDIVDQTVRGGRFGDQINNAMLPNADSPIFRFYTLGSSDTASTTNVSPAATVSAITIPIDLGVGKWAVVAFGSVHLSHSAGGGVEVAVEIEGTVGTVRTVSSVGTTGVRCEAHLSKTDEVDWVQGEQTLNCRTRFRSSTAGTTSAKNPVVVVFAKRME
jgi:hypothetical protein